MGWKIVTAIFALSMAVAVYLFSASKSSRTVRAVSNYKRAAGCAIQTFLEVHPRYFIHCRLDS